MNTQVTGSPIVANALPTIVNAKLGDFTPMSSKDFKAAVDKLEKRLDGVETVIHHLAVTAIFYAQTEGDYDKAKRIMEVLKKSPVLRNVAIDAWFKMFSNIEFVIADSGAVSARKNKRADANACDWEKAYANPFWTISELNEAVEKPNYTVADAMKQFFALSNRIKNMAEGKGNVRLEPGEHSKLLFLKEQIAITGEVLQKQVDAIPADKVVTKAIETTEGTNNDTVETALDKGDGVAVDADTRKVANG